MLVENLDQICKIAKWPSSAVHTAFLNQNKISSFKILVRDQKSFWTFVLLTIALLSSIIVWGETVNLRGRL